MKVCTMKQTTLLFLLLSAVAAHPAAGQDAEAPPTTAELYERAKRASVEVLVDGHLSGSGWFADAEGLVMTASHVIRQPDARFEVLSPVAGRMPAKPVAVDMGRDLGLLRVEPREGGYPALPLADRPPPPGEEIFLLGAPVFRHAVLLRGMVARDGPAFEYYAELRCYIEIVHVAATVQHGTSGGPWFNRRGQVVGLQSGVMPVGKTVYTGIAYVAPLDAIRSLLEKRRTTATPTIGCSVEEIWEQKRETLDRFPPGTEGLIVRLMRDDGPAARAGLKQWDLIIAADGQKVRLRDDLLGVIRRKQPGQPLELDVRSPDGTGTRKVAVRLGKLEVGWPDSGDEAAAKD